MRHTPMAAILLLLALLAGAAVTPIAQGDPAGPEPPASASRGSLFIENAGQWPEAARFQVWGGGETLWLAEQPAIPAAPSTGTPTPTATPTSLCHTTATPHPPFDGALLPVATVAVQVAHCMDDAHERVDRSEIFFDWDFIRTGGRPDDVVGAVPYQGGFLFRDLRIPQDAHITEATLWLYARYFSGLPIHLELAAEDRAMGQDFNPANPLPHARPRTDARVAWTLTEDANTWLPSPDLSAVIAELVSRDDWRPGNDIAILVDAEPGATSYTNWWSFDGQADAAGWLDVAYEAAATRTPTPTVTPTPTRTPPPTVQAVSRAVLPPAPDGLLAEWNGLLPLALSRSSASAITGAVPEPADASAILQVAWDAGALYLAVHVRDDAVREGDAFELALLPDPGGPDASPRNHAYRFHADGRQFDRGAAISALAILTRTVPTGYDLEVTIPTAHLGWQPLAADFAVPFNWALADADAGPGVETRLIWRGSGIDQAEPAWNVLKLDAGGTTFTGLLEAGRWEWAGGGAFTDIYFVDAQHGWAAGTGIWRTTDGGATWQRTPVLENASVARVLFADEHRGWAVTTEGTLLRSEDGGLSWLRAPQPSVQERLKLVRWLPSFYLDRTGADRVWYGRSRGGASCYSEWSSEALLEISQDGGLNWSVLQGYGKLTGLDLYDDQHGWMAFDYWGPWTGPFYSASIQFTTDGGQTWGGVSLGWDDYYHPDVDNLVKIHGISFGSTTHGWMISSYGTRGRRSMVWRSTDGGRTWTEQYESRADWLQAETADRAWIGRGTELLRTTDGGATWVQVSSAAPQFVRFLDAGRAWGYTGGTIYRSSDGGATWQPVFTLPPARAAWHLDHLTGWAAAGSTIERTTDGGATWQAADTGLAGVDRFHFVDAQNGWAWHLESRGLAHTTDGGATWTDQSAGFTDLDQLQFTDPLHGWMIPNLGEFGCGDLLSTTDSGATWRAAAVPLFRSPGQNPVSPYLWQLLFVDSLRGWALGGTAPPGYADRGILSRSDDGGATWSTPRDVTFANGIFFLDRTRGWAWKAWVWYYEQCGTTRPWEISWTSDAGESWQVIATGTNRVRNHPGGLIGLDAERVWQGLSGEWVYYSSDGGATWAQQRVEAPETGGLTFDRLGRITTSAGTLAYRETELSAYRAVRPPTLDGDLGEWAGVPSSLLKAENAGGVVGQAPAPLDASAGLQVAWDDDALYFALRAYDDAVLAAGDPRQGDGIELGLDGRHDHACHAGAQVDDFSFSVSAEGNGWPAGCIQAAQQRWERGYSLEIAIPRICLGGLGLAAQQITGFAWALVDRDGGAIESRLAWAGQDTSCGDASWGQLRLSALSAGFQPPPIHTPTPTPTSRAPCRATPTPHPTFDGALPPTAVVTRQVAHCMDDAHERVRTSEIVFDWDFVRVGDRIGETPPPASYMAGFVFRDVHIPQGARIISATLQLNAAYQNFFPLAMLIAGDDRAMADDFNPANLTIHSRPRTAARVPWTLTAAAAGWVESPDIAAIVQELVARGDWHPGNDLALLIDPGDSQYAYVNWWSFDDSEINAARLVVAYDATGPTPTATPTPTITPTATATPSPTITPTPPPNRLWLPLIVR